MTDEQEGDKSFEAICSAYPDVEPTILAKTEVLRRGTKPSERALEAIQGMDILFREYQIFSWHADGTQTLEVTKKTPGCFVFTKDETTSSFRMNLRSPYVIDFRDNKFFFCDERMDFAPIEDVCFINRPKSLSKTLPDGTPYGRILWANESDSAIMYLTYVCEFWKTDDQCRFCDSGGALKQGAKKGLKGLGRVSPQVVAGVVKEVFDSEPQLRHLGISGGTTLDADKECDFCCSYFSALNDVYGGQWESAYHKSYAVVAREEKFLKRVRDSGVNSISLNLEVWDERLFNLICPGKAKLVGREEWIKRAIRAVDIFGRGNVLTDFVAGVEMAQPWGFTDPHEAARTTLQGWEFLMAHDVLPRYDVWFPGHGSFLHSQDPAPLSYYIELARGLLELMEKYSFSRSRGGRERYGTVETTNDWWYHYHRKQSARC